MYDLKGNFFERPKLIFFPENHAFKISLCKKGSFLKKNLVSLARSSTVDVEGCLGGFHLHLLVFPFVYQFNSRIGVLVHSSFANDYFRGISTSFHCHFKICLLWLLHEKQCSFYIHLFYCTEMR